MADFQGIVTWVLQQEDRGLTGEVVDLGDGGGLTRYGIAQTKHEALPPDFYVAAPALALTYAKVIYKGEYWDRFLGDEIASDDVASCLLSFAINDGDAREIKMLQQVLNVPVDGVMGPQTLRWTNGANPSVLAAQLRLAQEDWYRAVYEANPAMYAKDVDGWILSRTACVPESSMTLITVVCCNIAGCTSRVELADDPVQGAEEVLEIRLADGLRLHFCCIEHLRQWASQYVCKFKAPKPQPTKAPVAWPKK